MKTHVNRFNLRLMVGDTVSVCHPRGGHYVAKVKDFETKGHFVRAYGAQVIFESGQWASPDDCTLLIPADSHAIAKSG